MIHKKSRSVYNNPSNWPHAIYVIWWPYVPCKFDHTLYLCYRPNSTDKISTRVSCSIVVVFIVFSQVDVMT